MRIASAVALCMLTTLLGSSLPAEDSLPYRSPFDVAYSPQGGRLAVSDRTAGSLMLFDFGSATRLRQVELQGQPTGIAWLGDDRVLVAEYDGGAVAEIDAVTGKVVRRLPTGLRPMGIAVATKRGVLVVANTVEDDVSIVDLKTGAERGRVRVPREPFFVAITPDATTAVVGNLLPAGSAANPRLSAAISLLDLERIGDSTDVYLPPGSSSVRQVAVSPDGHWAYVVHTVGRFNLPTTQLDRGWVNTNALSIIDLAKEELYVTVLLDHPVEGAADPWGAALSADGSTLWISLRGLHKLARVDVGKLHELLAGKLPPSLAEKPAAGGSARGVWQEIQRDPKRRELLVNELSALYVADIIERLPLTGQGPRGLSLSPDGSQLAVAMYYSGSITLVNTDNGRVASSLSLGDAREPDAARRGEMQFHDAMLCFQHWMSCATCHPDNGRTDGLRWDLLNDGIGTPQRTRSLLLSHKLRPTTARGVRGGIEESVPKGITFLLHEAEKDLVDDITAYIAGLEPEPSIALVDGKLSEAAERGKVLFEGKAECAECHSGELYTDMKSHDVGSRGEFDRPGERFVTPKLVELYRTAPYLHDGRSATLKDVLTRYDPQRRHGKTGELTPAELEDLVEYLRSL